MKDRPRPPGEELVKIWFKFVPREGWLSIDTEGLWAVATGPDTASIRNVPFLQDGVAEGDVIRYVLGHDDLRWATQRVQASGNCTIRVLPVPSGPLGRSAQAVHDRLAPFGLGGEVFSDEFPLLALTVPAEADLAAVKATLDHGQAEGWWQYETACSTPAWDAA